MTFDDRLAQLREKATPGPWTACGDDEQAPFSVHHIFAADEEPRGKHRADGYAHPAVCERRVDAAYIAFLSPDRVKRIEAVIRAAREMLAVWPKRMRPRGLNTFTDLVADLEDKVAALDDPAPPKGGSQ
jgi:hypothetical protein